MKKSISALLLGFFMLSAFILAGCNEAAESQTNDTNDYEKLPDQEVQEQLQQMKEEQQQIQQTLQENKENQEKLMEEQNLTPAKLIFKEKVDDQDMEWKDTQLTNKYLDKADVMFTAEGSPIVTLSFNEEGTKLFEEITGNNVGKPLAIFIDDELITAPFINQKIMGGKAQIAGTFTIDEAMQLANELNMASLSPPQLQ